MTRILKTRFELLLLATVSFLAIASYAESKEAFTEVKAKELIKNGTQVKACGDASYEFQSVQIGRVHKEKDNSQNFELYPVQARYAVTCRYGDEKMRAEVSLRVDYYQDEFGAWKSTDPGFDSDQSWDNTQSNVRCRVQNLAHLTVDANNMVTGSTPAKDQGFMGCTVMSKAAD